MQSSTVKTVTIIRKGGAMFQIDNMSHIPVYEQLVGQVETYVLKGILSRGDQLPSVRSLAGSLAVNPNTIQKAMAELDRKGIICSVPGKGCFISDKAQDILREEHRGELKGFKEQLKRFRMAGIERSEIEKCVDEVYSEKRDQK